MGICNQRSMYTLPIIYHVVRSRDQVTSYYALTVLDSQEACVHNCTQWRLLPASSMRHVTLASCNSELCRY